MRSSVPEVPAGCPLTRRQLQVISLSSLEGLQSPAIALRLGLTRSTVRSHLDGVYRALDVVSAGQAAVVCFNAGWLDPNLSTDDPTRFEDRAVNAAQRTYLDAFDSYLVAHGDHTKEVVAKFRTDSALVAVVRAGVHGRSVTERDWMTNELLNTLADTATVEPSRQTHDHRLDRAPPALTLQSDRAHDLSRRLEPADPDLHGPALVAPGAGSGARVRTGPRQQRPARR